MKAVVDMLQRKRNEEFTVEKLVRGQILPWAKNARTIVRIIRFDMATDNELRTRIEGDGNGKRYFIKGKNILSYIERYGAVLTGRKLK